MSRIALSALERAADGGEFDELAERVKGAILGRLSAGKIEDLAVMTDLIYVLRACEYGKIAATPEFEEDEAKTEAKTAAPKPATKDAKELFKWLIANRRLSRVLFRGMQDASSPKASLDAIAELRSVGEKKLLTYAELATAFATSRSAECYHKQPNPASMIEAFKYYTTRRMRYDLKSMPFELSRYLTDSKLSIAERKWAYGKYNRYPNPAKSYFDLRYDKEHLERGDPKKISKLEFTLANLRKVGGVCIEQAYYSSEVCKSVGIPAQIVTGRSGDGIYHAWMMCFVRNPGRRSASWDSTTGRYAEQKYFVGYVRNPVDGTRLLDCELMLEGAAALLSPVRREDADTATALAILAADVANARQPADLADLKALAEMYKKRFGKSPIDAESLEAKIRIDMLLVEGLLQTALNCNLANRAAWDFILELRVSRDMLKVAQLSEFFDVLITRTAREYPDYSCEMVMRIVPSIPGPADRMKIYQKALGAYSARRDLRGRILIACGDDCASRSKPALALKFYQTAATENVDLASIVTEASGKAERLLIDAGHAKTAVLMYTRLFKAARKPPKVSGIFAGQHSYYILGDRLATLLNSTGDARRARKIRTLIEK